MSINGFTDKDVNIISEEVVYKGFFSVSQYTLQHALFDGGTSPEIVREVMKRHHAVGILPYDPEADEVVLVEQFRIGALGQLSSPWVLEVVAGLIDKDESIEEVAHREMQEEAGLMLNALEPIYRYLPSPGGSSECVHLFCGHVSARKAAASAGVLEEGEDIRVHVMSADNAIDMLHQNKIQNAASIIALQWLASKRDMLKAKWLI